MPLNNEKAHPARGCLGSAAARDSGWRQSFQSRSQLGLGNQPAVDDPEAVPAGEPGQLQLLPNAEAREAPSDGLDVGGAPFHRAGKDGARQILDFAIEDPLFRDVVIAESEQQGQPMGQVAWKRSAADIDGTPGSIEFLGG